MLKQLQKRRSDSAGTISGYRQQGFTIIEVLIVLAIAGLIMVVVFLAVPALQRSGRNNALSTDANNTLTGVSNYVSNNGGTLPNAVNLTGTTVKVTGSGGNAETVTVDGNVTAATLINGVPGLSGVLTTASPIGSVQIVTGTAGVCNGTDSGLSATAGSARAYVVLYVAESGSGNVLKCIGG